MATIQATIEAAEKLSSSSLGISLNYDVVIKEAIKNHYEQLGTPITEEQIKELKDKDYDNNPKVKAYYKSKIAEFKTKTGAVMDQVKQIPITFAGITAASASATAAPAAVPQVTSIKTQVSAISSQLADSLNICGDLGVGAPDSLVSLIDKFASLKSLVGL